MLECFLKQRSQLQLDAVVKTQARQLFSGYPAITAPMAIVLLLSWLLSWLLP